MNTLKNIFDDKLQKFDVFIKKSFKKVTVEFNDVNIWIEARKIFF